MAHATTVINNPQHISPAELWIGPVTKTRLQVTALLKRLLCSSQGCDTCNECKKIVNQQHHAIMWLSPERQYTRDQLEPIFNQLVFQLDDNESYFFIIEKADFLTPACANSLLKSLEEPPTGYHFLLLAERLNLILPTIQSRCIIHQIAPSYSPSHHSLFDFFTTIAFHDPNAFSKTLDQSNINERESIELLDELLHYWIDAYRHALLKKNSQDARQTQNVISILSRAHSHAPMPGSSKFFWQNLFIALKSNF